MPGRYARSTPAWVFARALAGELSPELDDRPSYNIAPGSLPAIAWRASKADQISIISGYWKFIAKASKNGKIAPINVPADTAPRRRMFKRPFSHQRALVLADWWYEWTYEGLNAQPHAIRPRASGPFVFAAIWSQPKALTATHSAAGQVTFAIMTDTPSADIAHLNCSQPLALTPDAARAWLSDETDPQALRAILDEGRYSDHEHWPVSSAIGNIANDAPEFAAVIAP